MKDKKSKRRAMMATYEQRMMLARYDHECIDYEAREETPDEKKRRLRRREQQQKHKDRYWIK